MQKLLVGGVPTWNFVSKWPCWSEISYFLSIFVRSASAVWPSKKSSHNTNRKSLTHFPTSLRWSSYVAPKSPQRGAQKRSCDDSETARDRMSVTIESLIGSRIRAFSWYLPRWPWMTLSSVIALILRFLTEFDCFAGQLRHSGWRQAYNVLKYCLPFMVFHVWP